MTYVILDDAASGTRLCFTGARDVIAAHEPQEVGPALAALRGALARGHHAAGFLAYELGYALEPHLAPLMPSARKAPLLWFGIFGAPQAVRDPAPDPMLGRAYAGPLRFEWDEKTYAARFARVKDYVAAGDIYQANLSLRARFAFVGDARALYEKLRGESGAPHCAFVEFSGHANGAARHIISLSPELFFDLAADGTLTARPMKGTAPRAGDDAAARAALAASPKERAENLMIVDLTRNDLGRIAQTGSVAVESLFAVETYPTLHAMVSTVTARLRPGFGAGEILGALFPCGSITGAPKIRAMQVIRELESGARGVYCGAIGAFAPDGSARFNVAIRTLMIEGGMGELGIGGAVIQDSACQAEYAECLLKARFFEAARRPLTLVETLRYESGFVRLSSHLARMRVSAAVFGMAFDEEAARAALASVVAGHGSEGALRVRLELDEAGRFAATRAPLPPNPAFWTYAISPRRVPSHDVLLRHKTAWRELYESEVARLGADEAVFLNERGELAEGARTNIFVARGGKLLTPPLASGALDGRLRAELIAEDKAAEALLYEKDLESGELFLGNSLRGLIPAKAI